MNIFVEKSKFIRRDSVGIVLSLTAVIFSFALCLAYLNSISRLDEYLMFLKTSINAPTDDLHALDTILARTFSTMKSGLKNGAILIFFGTILMLFFAKLNTVEQRYIRPVFSIIIFVMIIQITGGLTGPSFGYEFSKMLFGVSCFLSFAVGFMLLREPQKGKKIDDLRLLALAMLSMFLVFAGSNVAAAKSNYALWLLFPFVCFKFIELIQGKTKYFQTQNIKHLLVWGMISLAVAGITIKYSNPFRDLNHRFLLTSEIDTPLTKGIYSSEGRAKCFSSVYNALQPLIKPGDRLLATSNFPMIHFATQTLPYLGNPKPKDLRLDQIKLKLTQIKSEQALPNIIVRNTINTGNLFWGHAPAPTVLDRYPPVKEINNFISEYGYIQIWKNECFELLSRHSDG